MDAYRRVQRTEGSRQAQKQIEHQPDRGPLMRPTYLRRFWHPTGGISRGKGLGNIRMTPLFVQRTVPQSDAEQARSSAPSSRVHPCPSVVLSCPGPATNRENCGLRPTNLPSQNNSLATLLQ